MSERQFTRSCPYCGAVSPLSAPACLRCGQSFSLTATRQRATSYKKVVSWVAGISLVLVLLFFAAALGLLHADLSSTTAYQEALKLAKASPAVQAALGDNIHLRSTALGVDLTYAGSEFVQFSVSLGGSHGSGRLYAVANSTNRALEFSRLSFLPSEGRRLIDLTPMPQRQDLPAVPAKKVYLFPLGLDGSEPLDWAPAYYQAKFGIEVEVFPPVPVTEKLKDPKRHQLNSEACVEYIRDLHPELDADPSAILIAVTSRDIYIPTLDWAYAENDRPGARFAVVSSARLHPQSFMARLNPEWLHSRLQKMMTKNIAMLYFDLPLSSDYTSLLSGGVLQGQQIDFIGGTIIGTEGRWHSFVNGGNPGVSIYSVPGKPPMWRLTESGEALPQPGAHVFSANLGTGFFIDRTEDFHLEGEYPLRFTRTYRNRDRISRSFGIGTNDSLDIFLTGQMGVAVDLIYEDGARLHFAHSRPGPGVFGDAYRAANGALAVYAGDGWTVTMRDGSKLYFPYRPNYLGYNVTVLTGYTDPGGHKYEMERNSFGELLSVTTPSGHWLHFERDTEHRVHRISDSTGRVVTYDYDDRGCLSKVADSDGHTDSYTYDEKFQMLTVTQGSKVPAIINEYDSGQVISQTLANGEKFMYHYTGDPEGRGSAMVPDVITDPRGLDTYFVYNSGGYIQSLPQRGEKREPLH